MWAADMEMVSVKNAYMEPVFGANLDETRYKVTFMTEEGMSVEFILTHRAVHDFIFSTAGVAMQVRARYPEGE